MTESTGFTSTELLLGYHDWKELSEFRLPHLRKEVRQWFAAWQQWDIACSPMDDDERRVIRCGHYFGWFASKKFYESETE